MKTLYDGKTKTVLLNEDTGVVNLFFKDSATGENGYFDPRFNTVGGSVEGKGKIGLQISKHFFEIMEKNGIPTHYLGADVDKCLMQVRKLTVPKLEFVLRYFTAGSMCRRFSLEEGIVFDQPTIEFSYKNDALGDPLLNTYHALALKLATAEEIETIKKYAFTVNDVLKAFWAECGVTLVDFKLEFGKTVEGQIILADEISPDTCRLWDSKTHEKLDKDRFRRDMGGVEDAYAEIMKRLLSHDAD